MWEPRLAGFAPPLTKRHSGRALPARSGLGVVLCRAQKERAASLRPIQFGGGGGNRTPVRRHSMPGTTCLARCWFSCHGNTACEAHQDTYPLRLSRGWRVAAVADPVISDPTSTSTGTSGFRAYALSGESVVVVVGNYEFCSWISEESYPLGMRQTISQPPSKPVHPRECRCRRHRQYRCRSRFLKAAS